MSTTGKIALFVAVILIGAGIYYFWNGNANQAPSPAGQSAANAPVNGAKVASNASIDQDLANIDTQMNAFASDSATIDQGLNDQPVSQSQL